MYNIEEDITTGEKVYKAVLDNGLSVFVCPKQGFTKKIGMYGTIYGSIDNEFIDIMSGQKVKVEDGIAHFLEHKLFEQEGENALDLFAKMGVSSNAYTSFDHTVYFFETSSKYEECLEKLLEFVNTPYFTDINVEKEKGIIGQEIRMYDDEPNAVVYYNMLRAMYKEHPLKVDIAGTVESVNRINKEALYSCYNTFYNPSNMFVIVIGDVSVKDTIDKIDHEMKTRYSRFSAKVERFYPDEPKEIATPQIEKKLDVYMPYICMGFKHGKQQGKKNIKNTVIVELIDDICFSSLSDFYEKMYKESIINDPIQISYECGMDFSHTVIFATSKKYNKCEKRIKEYIQKLREDGVDNELFKIAKNKKKGEYILETENLMAVHRQIIDSIIQQTDVYEEINVLQEITKTDVDNFIKEYLTEDTMVISRVIEK